MCPSHFCRVRVTSSSSQSHLKFFRVTRTVESLWVIFICLQARVNVDCNIRALSHKVKYDCNVQRIGTNINKLTASKHATMRSSTFCIFRETGEPTRFFTTRPQTWMSEGGRRDFENFRKKGCFHSFKLEKTNFTTFVRPWKNFGKIPWWPPLEKNPSDAHGLKGRNIQSSISLKH